MHSLPLFSVVSASFSLSCSKSGEAKLLTEDWEGAVEDLKTATQQSPQACPKASTFKNKGLPNVESMKIMFEGTVAMGKNAFCTSGEIPKECTEESRDSANNKEFVDPQCQPSANVDQMEVEGPSSSRAGPAVNKGKGLASGVHLFRGVCKKPRKKRSIVQEMSNSLKNISYVIVESKSVSTRTPFASTTATEVLVILDMVLSLTRVQFR
ncbi:uncharacterized protein LOC126733125 isoform X2 [Quercus robur]|uniref:uncharacterized protein LOC126733125 isoform X2 n=1 Tax=Quercus robur TaxID=38942 RepID=UPI0021626FDE|nr:uncharacterized protein LOC126733125 isoform X2 [Quercus robur]XP_050292267.1 uncharacterized protein LOC126733125 isoform X2 [Quercus robur]